MSTRYEGAGALDTSTTIIPAGEEIGYDEVPEGQVALCFEYDEVFYLQGKPEDIIRLLETTVQELKDFAAKESTIYAYLDTVPEPIPADRWMWQTGNNWMAVAPFESEADWFADMDEPTPTPRVRPINDIPTTGTLSYMRADFTPVERPADGKKEQ